MKDLLEHPERIEQGSTVAVLDSWQGTDEDLTLIHKLGHVRKVSLQSPRVTDAGLRALESLPDVKKFHISNCRISADGIGLLAGIPSLQQITLLDTPVSNTACNDLAQLPELKALWIGEGQLLTEAGLAALAQSSSIEILEIDRLTLSAGVVENGGLSIDRAPMDNPPGNTCTTRIILRGEFDVLALAHFCQRFEKLAVLDLNGAFIANGNVEDLRRMLPGVQIDNQPAAWGPIDCWK